MNISIVFNSFYHGPVLNELFKKANCLKFEEFGWVDVNTGKPFVFQRGEDYDEMDELKQLLKNMNIDYPVDEEEKISTRKIDSKALSQHIEWCIKLAGLNNIEFSFIEDEWTRLLKQAHSIPKKQIETPQFPSRELWEKEKGK